MNTLKQYADTVAGEILPQGVIDKIFFKRYQKKREALAEKLYGQFENVAKSYHGIAAQNMVMILETKCMDVHGKRTKKVNYTEIFNVSKSLKFVP